ncbi:MAG: DivIVA domain-containing protein, partial [Acidimicrobiia bacterium]|nr:DivIVA domain-containing protein [Acidimicrobiia bacterium]
MADDRIVISSEPGVTPDEITRRSFPVVFRGYDQEQVRRYLKKAGDELAAARQREQELRHALEEARRTLAHPELDEATLTAALGEETTRILRSAREASADMRTKAEERVARMVQEADEHGARLRHEAEGVLARRVEEADEAAANIRAAAEADARHVHDRVQAELDAAKARGREMIAEAQVVRERIIGDLARRRRAAHIQIEQLLAGRDRLLETYRSVRGTFDEITAELEQAEDKARRAAEAAHRRAVDTPPDDSDLEALAAAGAEVVGPEMVPPEMVPPEMVRPEMVPPEVVAPEVVPPEVAAQPEPPRAQQTPPNVEPETDPWALPEPVMPVPPSVSVPATPAEPVEDESVPPSLVRLQPFDEEEGVRIIGPVAAPEAPPAPAPEPAPSPAPEPAPDTALDSAGDSAPDSPGDTAPEGAVDDLFARLRAERQGAVINAQRVLADQAEAPAVDEGAEGGTEPEPEAAVDEAISDGEPVVDADRALLEQRDERLAPVATDLARRLKRVLQDEQNEILDRLRQSRGRARPDEALPAAGDQAGRYRDAAIAPLAQAADAG